MQNIRKYLNVRNVLLGIGALGSLMAISCGQPKAVPEPTKQAYVEEAPGSAAMPYSTAASMPYSTATSVPYPSPIASTPPSPIPYPIAPSIPTIVQPTASAIPKPAEAKTASVVNECKDLTTNEINLITDYFNRTGKAIELYGSSEREYIRERGEARISESSVSGGFLCGDEMLFVITTPQTKGRRAEFFAMSDEEIFYRSGGIYTIGTKEIKQRENGRVIELVLEYAGPGVYMFERQNGSFSMKR